MDGRRLLFRSLTGPVHQGTPALSDERLGASGERGRALMNWTGKRVLVTGAGGFIGSHLVEELVRRGKPVRAFLHYNSAGRRGWLEESPLANDIEFVSGSVRDSDSVRRAVQGCTTVYHLAALVGIPYSYVSPQAYLRTNVD